MVKLIDEYHCPYCSSWHKGVPEIDHLLPISRGGTHTMDNLTLACRACNAGKSDKTPEEFAAYKLICVAA